MKELWHLTSDRCGTRLVLLDCGEKKPQSLSEGSGPSRGEGTAWARDRRRAGGTAGRSFGAKRNARGIDGARRVGQAGCRLVLLDGGRSRNADPREAGGAVQADGGPDGAA